MKADPESARAILQWFLQVGGPDWAKPETCKNNKRAECVRRESDSRTPRVYVLPNTDILIACSKIVSKMAFLADSRKAGARAWTGFD